MIEIEKKFSLSSKQLTLLLQNSKFLKEIVFTDTYFDTKNYSLTRQDKWLRIRNDKPELKIPLMDTDGKNEIDQYREVDEEHDIRNILQVKSKGNLLDDLQLNGYIPIANFTTTRNKYMKEGFGIDIDSLDFGFNIVEIELMVDDKAQIQEAVERILAFAAKHNLSTDYVRGKVIEYAKRYNPELYQAIKDSGLRINEK